MPDSDWLTLRPWAGNLSFKMQLNLSSAKWGGSNRRPLKSLLAQTFVHGSVVFFFVFPLWRIFFINANVPFKVRDVRKEVGDCFSLLSGPRFCRTQNVVLSTHSTH